MAKGKTNWGKIAIWTAIIGGASVGLYFGIKAIVNAGKENKPDTQQPPAGGAENTEITSSTVIFPLTKGSGYGTRAGENAHVQVIQKYVNKLFPSKPMDADGKWGDETTNYIQAALGITSVNESQYNLINAGKSIKVNGFPPSLLPVASIEVNGVRYFMDEVSALGTAKRYIATALLRQLGKSVTESNIKTYVDGFSFEYMVQRCYYSMAGFNVFVYKRESYSVATGKKISI